MIAIGVRGGGGGGGAGGCSPPIIFQIAILIMSYSGKTIDFRASNGENIRATDLSPPKRNWSRTPMVIAILTDAADPYPLRYTPNISKLYKTHRIIGREIHDTRALVDYVT